MLLSRRTKIIRTAYTTCSILLLVWHRLRILGSFSRDTSFVSHSEDGGSDGSESEAEEDNTSKNLSSDSEEENQSIDGDQSEEDEEGDQSEEEDGGKQDVILKENGWHHTSNLIKLMKSFVTVEFQLCFDMTCVHYTWCRTACYM